MSAVYTSIATVDSRVFFEKVVVYGVEHGLIDRTWCDNVSSDAAKGTVQVADYFGTSHLLAGLDSARRRIVHLISLYLDYQFNGDQREAAQSLTKNSFLSHSRGGNELLKKLHALPASTMFDSYGQSLKEFQDERTLTRPMSGAAYRMELARRNDNAVSLAAARWFAQNMGLKNNDLEANDADSVLRTALLNRFFGKNTFPTMHEFTQRLEAARKNLNAAPTSLQKFLGVVSDGVPQKYHEVVLHIAGQIVAQDFPVLGNKLASGEALVQTLEMRYFLRDVGIEDIDAHEEVVSEQWHALTRGKEDPYSRLTMLICLAADVKPKPTLSTTQARTLIRKVRRQGFNGLAAPEIIKNSAPYSVRAALLTMWEEEFFPEAQIRLLDPADDKLIFAMQFLTENCNVEKK